MVLVQIALVLLVIGGGWHLLTNRRITRERDALTMRRVDAYIQTIRREKRGSELAAMSDGELRDLLFVGARNLHVASQRRFWYLLTAAGVTLFSAITIASHDGWRGFGITAAVGAVVTYGLNEYLTRRAKAPLERHGIDVDRLLVE